MYNGQMISSLEKLVEKTEAKKPEGIQGTKYFKIALSRFWEIHPELFALSFHQLEEKSRLDIIESAMILRAEADRVRGLRKVGQ